MLFEGAKDPIGASYPVRHSWTHNETELLELWMGSLFVGLGKLVEARASSLRACMAILSDHTRLIIHEFFGELLSGGANAPCKYVGHFQSGTLPTSFH